MPYEYLWLLLNNKTLIHKHNVIIPSEYFTNVYFGDTNHILII